MTASLHNPPPHAGSERLAKKLMRAYIGKA
jgi:hypothetical protein